MLAARLQLRRRCIRCCSCSFSSEQAARRSSSESANQQQHADSAERVDRSQLQSSSSEHGPNSTLPTLEEQAEMNFEILAVMSKSNARFSTRQHIADENEDEEDSEQNDNKHLAPQHRRFLSHPQIGAGTPHDRAARNNKLRLSLAVSNSHDYMMEKQGLMSDEAGSNRLTQAKGLDAIVEDKIQMAIMRGDFDGLENKGKPLNIERNSLVNPAVEVVSRLLAQNGILPSWIEKQKHVTELTTALQARLAGEWAAAHININSSSSTDSSSAWQAANAAAVTEAAVYSGAHSSALSELNAAIDGYNLEVPAYHLQRGRARLDWLMEAVVARAVRDRAHAEQLLQAAQKARRM
eukprot:18594-Heterococcus_DN1.PRE.1